MKPSTFFFAAALSTTDVALADASNTTVTEADLLEQATRYDETLTEQQLNASHQDSMNSLGYRSISTNTSLKS
ncbi:hypothetical protein JCM19240_5746 [Vibrio maritimus]|uniref:Uncharacterized protein n=1 Tax=Vibrio maritimus TaxID=990268 RepID=A0A090SX07_9VIBR|nr:hypothetical protein JCM19240_5746 [Vibrio maritimus]